LHEELLAELLAREPRSWGYRATSWTAPLLRRQLQQECGCPVSERTLRRRLHEYGWNGKRLRYVYGQRDSPISQKKRAFASV
jgi:transposase